MLNRRLGMNVVDNPLVDSPFIQQDDIGYDFSPITQNSFLLLSGAPFQLLSGQNFELLS